MEPGSLTEPLLETLAVFDETGEPRTTPEIAESLGLGRRSTYARLERLVEEGRLETKKVGANARVWWRSTATADSTPADWSAAAESLVDDVLADVEVGIFVLDADFDVAWINDATERYFGLEREQVVGRDKRQLIDERIALVVENAEAFTETVNATYDDNTYTEHFECRVTAGDEQGARWLEHRSKPIESGEYAGGRVELYYDVTDRKRSERARRDDREQFESLVDAVEEYAIFTLDTDGYVRTWNSGAELIKGYEADEVLGEHFSIFYTGDACEAGVPEQNLAAAAEHGSLQDEGWRIRKDRSMFWASVSLTPIRDDDGELQGYAKVTRDMTERREQEGQLRRERDLTERLLETAPVGLAVFREDGSIDRINSRLRNILGIDESAAVAFDIERFDIYDPDGNPISAVDTVIPRVFSAGESISDWLVQYDGANGNRRWISLSSAPLYDTDGNIDRAVLAAKDVTDLKRTERQLSRQRDELRSELEEVFDRIDDGVFALDENWRFTYLNDSAEVILGKTEAELLDRNVWSVFPAALERSFKTHYEQALECQEPVTFVEFSDEVDAWLEVSAYPSESGISVYFRDITERKETEESLRKNEERLRLALDAADLGSWELDLQSERSYNRTPQHDRIFGYEEPVDEWSVDRFLEHVHPDDRDTVEQHLEDGYETGCWAFECRINDADGIQRWIEVNGEIHLNADGERARAIGVIRDITERKERQRAIEESEGQYRALVENFPNGIVALFDEKLEYTLIGGASLEQDGIEPRDFEGTSVGAAVDDPEARDRIVKRYTSVFEGDSSEFEFEWNDQTMMIQAVPVTDEHGDVFAGMAMSQDVTERNERERQIVRQRDQLAALNSLNEVVRDITDAVIDQSTREEIESTVCERLVDSNSYQLAWIGDADSSTQTVNERTAAGFVDYLDEITITIDPADERSDGPTGRAFRTGEIQTTQNIADDPRHDPWRDQLDAYNFQSTAAIPIVHDGTVLGVLNVYAERPHAFEGREREMFTQLGEIIGHAIAAAERKQALMSDDLVELEFQIQDAFSALDEPVETEGTITFDNSVSLGDDQYLIYGTATPDAADTVTALTDRLSYWERVTLRPDEDHVAFELRVTEPPVVSAVASVGGYVKHVVVEDGDITMTIHLAPSVDVRRVIDAVEDAYPGAEMVRRRQITRSREDPRRIQRHLIATLTDRQRAALDAAYHAGFFEWPRETSGEDVADSMGVAPSTFHQHLRKAQRKVFDSVFSTTEQPAE